MTASQTFIIPEENPLSLSLKFQEEKGYLESKLKDLENLSKFVEDVDLTSLPAESRIWVNYDSINVTVPWGTKNLRKARLLFGRGWEFRYKHDQSDGGISYHYVARPEIPGEVDSWGEPFRSYFTLNISMSPTVLPEGSCKRILVSEEERTYKVQKYKVVCDTGEMTEQEVVTA